MSEQKENDPPLGRVTRASKKRATAEATPLRKRQRVALGELKNLPNLPAGSRLPSKREVPCPKRCLKPDDPPAEDHRLAADIDSYLRSLEADAGRRPRHDYMEAIQTDLTAPMRAILVDWLVEVAEEYNLTANTLYLSVSYVDRFLSHSAVTRQMLQLVGITSMFIASKYEEIKAPNVEELCYITDNTYTKQEVLNMEEHVLKFLKFELGNPTIKTFLRRITRAGLDFQSWTLQLEFLCSYLAELSLVDYGCLRFLPSVIASSSVFLAKFTLNPDAHPWNSSLQNYTGYRPSQLKDCVLAVHDLQLNRKNCTLVAVRDKYNQHKFKFVPKLSSPQAIPGCYFEDIESHGTASGTFLKL